MTSDSTPYIPFSQREGFMEIPPQLGIGEVSTDLRRLIYYYISLEIDRESYAPYESAIFKEGWKRVAMDLHVILFKKSVDGFDHSAYNNQQSINLFIQRANIGELFDLVELLLRHSACSDELKHDFSYAFINERAAYRIVDNEHIVAIGTGEQAAAFERAITDAELKNAATARNQLIAAGLALRTSDWAGSIRQSIHAVEAMAIRLAPGAKELGPALKILENNRYIHGGLKSAFRSLYGYSSDEEGLRHALVFKDKAQVDEADALFMLGACASFVSYLLARRV